MFWHTARDDPMFNTIRVISRHQDTQIYGAILANVLTNQEMLDSKAYKEYYVVASGAEPPKAQTKYKKKADEPTISPKKKLVQATKGTRLKSKAKVTKPDKKKQPAKKTKAKDLAVLFEVALSEAEQIKLATKRSKKDFHISHASGSGDRVDTQLKVPREQQKNTFSIDEGTGTIPGVPDVPPYKSKSDKESWGDSKDEDDNDDDNQTEYEEEDVEERARSEQQNVSQEIIFEQEEEDAHVTLTPVPDAQKPAEPVQSSSVSSDFTSKFLNLENLSLADNEIASLMETLTPHATAIPEITFGFTITTHPPPSFFNPLLQQQTQTITTPTFTTITFTNPTVTLPEIPNFASVFKFDQRVFALESKMSELKKTNQFSKVVSSIMGIVDKHLASKMKEAVNVDEDPLAGSDRGMKRRKYEEPSYTVEELGMHQDQEFIMGDNNEQPIDKEVTKADWLKIPNLTQEILVGLAFNLLKGTCKSITKLEYHLEECSKATTKRLDWYNPENKLRYSTFVTKTKASTYKLKLIKDLVPKLWSHVVVKYDQHAYFSTSHWGPKRQSFYRYACNLTSSKDAYTRRRNITVTRLTIMKKYDYGHLEEIEVRLDDQQLYTFKEDVCPSKTGERSLIMCRKLPKEAQSHQLDTFSSNLKNKTTYFTLRPSWNNIRRPVQEEEIDAMDYLPMQKWSNLDKKRARVMVHDINKQLYQRRLMRNLEKFVGGRPYGEDIQLLERTI
nr:hypothetical protein [Tanacetum cinerariifolium]